MKPAETISEKRQRFAVEGQEAWKVYRAEQKHIDENMHRLRAERVAREAEASTVIIMKSAKKKRSKKSLTYGCTTQEMGKAPLRRGFFRDGRLHRREQVRFRRVPVRWRRDQKPAK
jgi:hypothetical protein